MKKYRIFILFVLFVFTLIACEPIQEEHGSIDDTLTDGQISITVNEVFYGEESLFGELPEGEVWLNIEVTLQNVGQTTRNINSLLMFELEDEFDVYEIDIFIDTFGDLEGSLNVAERKTGILTFAVSQESEQFRLRFKPDFGPSSGFTVEIIINE